MNYGAGAWAVTISDDSPPMKGLRFEGYVWAPGLVQNRAMAVFVKPDNSAFLQEVTMLRDDGRPLLVDVEFTQHTDQYAITDTRH